MSSAPNPGDITASLPQIRTLEDLEQVVCYAEVAKQKIAAAQAAAEAATQAAPEAEAEAVLEAAPEAEVEMEALAARTKEMYWQAPPETTAHPAAPPMEPSQSTDSSEEGTPVNPPQSTPRLSAEKPIKNGRKTRRTGPRQGGGKAAISSVCISQTPLFVTEFSKLENQLLRRRDRDVGGER